MGEKREIESSTFWNRFFFPLPSHSIFFLTCIGNAESQGKAKDLEAGRQEIVIAYFQNHRLRHEADKAL